jgi:hypothetical protein
MLKLFNIQLHSVYANCLESYRDCVKYVNENKDGEIDANLITATTRRKLYKETLNLLGEIFKYRVVDITRWLKLRKIHINQLRKLESKRLKKNRLFFAQVESLFRKTHVLAKNQFLVGS